MSRIWSILILMAFAAFPLTFSGCGNAHMSQGSAETEEEILEDEETEADYAGDDEVLEDGDGDE